MSFPSDVSNDEMPMLDLPNFPGSQEPWILLTDESTGLIHVSQRSNGRTYQERSTVLQNPLEMQQRHQHQIMHQQQLGNSDEMGLQPPPWALTRRQDDLHNIRMVNLSDLIYPMQNQAFIPMLQMPPEFIRPQMSSNFTRPRMPLQMLSNFTRIPNLNVVPENNISFFPRPQIPLNSIRPQMSSNSTRIPNLNVVPIPMPAMPLNSIRPQVSSNFTRIPNLNVVPENNMSLIPMPQMSLNSIRPQMSSNSTRHHGNMQRSVNQSLLRYRFSTQIRPSANSTTPLQSEVLGSRRRSYQSRFEFGQSSSSPVQRRRISTNENIPSTSIYLVEPRITNRVYNPLYESLGMSLDPHLRNLSDMNRN